MNSSTKIKIHFLIILITATFSASADQATTPSNTAIPPDISSINQYYQEHPTLKTLCIPLGDDFKYATGEYLIDRKSFNAEDNMARWDNFVRLGLFSKKETKANISYKITQIGKTFYNDNSCIASAGPLPSRITGPALIYGSLEFDNVTKREKNPYHPVYFTYFKRRFAQLASWGADKELRRSWKQQGIEEIENIQWYAGYSITSNGLEFTKEPTCCNY